ncbi:hypothetical protein PQ456_04960 [Paenibacillus kyungheensis]|uniref:DUF4367 domain-containing protein n=1 Tax=Paenibacillus kyungheensis TaxID=1452732 RepID=A0AAX3M3Z0_9BACL|nr:hypothetical protein [Paenibacillus kyungheensis]WCT56876.1 hypothetical protein PQ456_04960 [Paenibacillus kyungheensis]
MSKFPQDPNNIHPTGPADSSNATDEAWAKLKSQLVNETPHSNWEKWANEPHLFQIDDPSSQPQQSQRSAITMKKSNEEQSYTSSTETEPTVKRRRKMSSARKRWTTGIAACVVAGAVIATPFGNNAMAALLDQFRVQTLTAVDSQQLSDMFDQYKSKNELGEMESRFGTFNSTYGKLEGEFSPSKAAALLNYTLMKEAAQDDKESVQVQSSRTETLIMNVDEVNKAIQSLGGKELLPQSLNNTPITMYFPESIYYTMFKGEDIASLTQTKVPTVQFDASVSTDEVFKAIADLPFLPQSLKDSLQSDKIINGSLPLPIESGGKTERVTIAGEPVLISVYTDNENPTSYSGTWIHNGELFTLDGGSAYTTYESFTKEIEKLIQS